MTTGQVSGNPFATRWVRPGAIPYEFPPASSAARLTEWLRDSGWRGAIVGPHGSGKSTLLHSLVPELERLGRRPIGFTLHDGQRRLPAEMIAVFPCDASTVIVVDGYEQLSRYSRGHLDRFCRRSACGLLVTSHGPTPLGELLRTQTDLALAQRIVARLLDGEPGCISDEEVARVFAAQAGNLRETLFTLYDLAERRRADSMQAATARA